MTSWRSRGLRGAVNRTPGPVTGAATPRTGWVGAALMDKIPDHYDKLHSAYLIR
jgi:hypothetical protein